MSFDKNTLKLAREWAEICGNSTGERISFESVEAAAEIIQELPDEIVDAAKVRELANKWRDDMPYSVTLRAVLEDIEDLLHPPRAEIRMGGWAMHPEKGKVVIISSKPGIDGDVTVAYEHENSITGTFLAWVKPADLSPLPEKPLFITHHHWSAGDQYATGGLLAPEGEEDQPGDAYRDKDGDYWVMHPEKGRWSLLSRDYLEEELPEEYEPYTKVEKP